MDSVGVVIIVAWISLDLVLYLIISSSAAAANLEPCCAVGRTLGWQLTPGPSCSSLVTPTVLCQYDNPPPSTLERRLMLVLNK